MKMMACAPARPHRPVLHSSVHRCIPPCVRRSLPRAYFAVAAAHLSPPSHISHPISSHAIKAPAHSIDPSPAVLRRSLLRKAINHDTARYNFLVKSIRAHSDADRIDKVEECLETLKRELFVPTTEVYESIMMAYAKHQQFSKAEQLYRQLKESGVQPSDRIYGLLIMGAFRSMPREKALELVLEYWAEMQCHGIPLPAESYSDLIHAVVAHDDVKVVVKSIDLLKQMLVRKISIPDHLWHTLLLKNRRDHVWDILQLMQLHDVSVPNKAVINVVGTSVPLSLDVLRYLTRRCKPRAPHELLKCLAVVDWQTAFEYIKENPVMLEFSKPLYLIVFAPSVELLRQATTWVESKAPLTPSDWAWIISHCFLPIVPAGFASKTPDPVVISRLYEVWRERYSEPTTVDLEQCLRGLMKGAPDHPWTTELWRMLIARKEGITFSLLEVAFGAFNKGATIVAGMVFADLLLRKKLSPELLQEFMRLTPDIPRRIEFIASSLDKKFEHTGDTINALVHGAALEGDMECVANLIEHAKFVSFPIKNDTWDVVAWCHATYGNPLDAVQVLQEVRDRSPRGSPDIPTEKTGNAVFQALIMRDLNAEAAKFYQRLRRLLYLPTLGIALPRLVVKDGKDNKFAFQLLTNAAEGRISSKVDLNVAIRRLCVRMYKAAQEANNRGAMSQILVWMHKHGVPLKRERSQQQHPEEDAADNEELPPSQS